MSIETFNRHAVRNIALTAIILLFTFCGRAQADEKEVPPEEQALRGAISKLVVEGLSLSLTPSQAHEQLTSTGYQIHKGTEPGHGIYWKNESKTLTKRIRLKSSDERIYQIQFSFSEKEVPCPDFPRIVVPKVAQLHDQCPAAPEYLQCHQ